MEFKGTKGVWEFVENENVYSVETLGIVDKPYWAICDTITKKEEDKANAQLIAHAPEMLEMLIEFVIMFDGVLNENTKSDELHKKAKQLITKATTI